MHPPQFAPAADPIWVDLILAPDQMSASLHFAHRPGKLAAEPEKEILPPSLEEMRARIQKLLADKKIIYGIFEEEIERCIQQWIREGLPRTHLIAKGTPAIDGTDASVKILFHPDESGKIGNTSVVDYKIRGYLCNVPKETKLLRLIKMKKPVPGKKITGEEIPAKAAKDLSVDISEGVRKVESELTFDFEVEQDSILEELNPARIRVTRNLEIKRDVDHHTGPVDVTGSVSVKGWVTPHLSVKATENVAVQEGVESAFVCAAGNLETQGGIIGKAELTEVKTGGDLTCRFIENAKIEVGGNAHIQDFIVTSRVYCNGDIHLTERHGLVLTSRLVAGGSVVANTLGSPSEGHVEVTAGNNPQAWRQVNRLEQELFFMKRQSYKIDGRKPFRNSEHHQHSLELRRAKKNRMGFILERVIERRKRRILSELGSKDKLPVIEVRKHIFPNTKIMMGPFSIKVREEMRGGTFKLDIQKAMIKWEPK